MHTKIERVAGKNQDRMEVILNSIQSGVMAIDRENHTIAYVNQAAARMIGVGPDQLLGQPCQQYICSAKCGSCSTYGKGQKADNSESILLTSLGCGLPILKTVVEAELDGRPVLVESFVDISEQKVLENELRKNEEKYRSLFEGAPLGIITIDPGGCILDVNSTLLETLGSPSVEETKQINVLEYPPMMKAGISADINQCLEKGKAIVSEHQYTTKWGKNIVMKLNLKPLPEGAGVQAIIEDISERKKAEMELRENEEKYRAFFATSRDCVFITTMDGRWVDFNDAAIDLFGYENREDLRKVDSPILYANPIERDSHIRHIQEKGYSFEYPVDLKKKDGTIISALVTTVVRKDSSGNVIGFQGTLRDITEKKAAQNKINELFRLKEEHLKIINASPAVAFLWKAEKNWPVEMVSSNISHFGYSTDDFISGRRSFSSIIHPDDLDLISEQVEYNSKNNINEFRQVYRIYGKEGSEYWIDDYTHIRRDNEGNITHYEGIILDITERKKAEEALKESEARLNYILKGSPMLQFVIDKNHRVISWNKAIEEASGIKEAEILGTRDQWKAFYDTERPVLSDLLLDEKVELLPEWYQGKISNSRLVTGAYEATNFFPKMGESGKWLYFTAAPIRNAGGAIIGAVETLEDITERRILEEERDRLITNLQNSLDNIKTLKGLIPICASCKKIRNDGGYWQQVEEYVADHTEADFSHGLCEECAHKLYPDYFPDKKN